MKADLLRIETMSSLETLSRVCFSIRDELSKVNDSIHKLEKELNSRTKNPKWYNYSCEYDLKIYNIKRRELILKLDEVESIINDMLSRGDEMTEREQNGEIKKYDSLPPGWKFQIGATTAPLGYAWAFNGKSRFSSEYKQALVKI